MTILAVSSLFYAINHVIYDNMRHLLLNIITLQGINLNPYAYNQLKLIKNLVESSDSINRRRDRVIWRDAINKTLTKHRSNWKPCSTSDLCEYLTANSFWFHAIAYCQRDNTPNTFMRLLSSGKSVLQVTKHIISRKNWKSAFVLKHYCQLNQDPDRELHARNVIWQHKDNLRSLLNKEKRKSNWVRTNVELDRSVLPGKETCSCSQFE